MRTIPFSLISIILTVALCISSAATAQQIWKWTDKNGVVHFSDQPAPGAVRVDVQVQTYDSAEATIPPTSRPSKPPADSLADAYRSIQVTQPSADETITGTGGTISVSVQIDPGLQPSHSVLIELNGQRVSEPGSALSHSLTEVPRGTHTLVASILADDGSVIMRSTPVTFHVFQQSIAQPLRQPTIAPRKRN